MKNRPRILASSVAACLFAWTAPKVHSQTNGTWSNLAGGSWAAGGNWTGGLIADGIGATADFSTLNITANATVTLDGTFTVGTLRFQDATTASNDWILNAGTGGPLTLDVATGSASIQVLNRTATINAVLASGATPDPISVTGAGTLVLGGANTFSNTLTIGSGMIVSARINGALGAAGAGNETIVLAGGTLDVQNATAGAINFQNEIVQISGIGVGGAGAITDTAGLQLKRRHSDRRFEFKCQHRR
jgi:autotransporter-associated beta strand protein